MGLIAVEGMHFFAYHGFYKEEQKLGNNYIVDVYLKTNLKKAAASDNLQDTINYEKVYEVASQVMSKKTKLLETLAESIANGLTQHFKTIEHLTVRISKLNPPMGGKIDRTYIEIDYDYSKRCSSCGQSMCCTEGTDCWCSQETVDPAKRKELKEKYQDCVCRDCLKG